MFFHSATILAYSWQDWLNYPGLEVWKFANLFIFLTVAILIVRKPIGAAFASRSESIKNELARARAEKEKAQAELAETEKLLSGIPSEVSHIKDQARLEADNERQRLVKAAEEEIRKLEMQGNREMEMAHRVALKELREFLAKRSIEFATENVQARLRPEDDARIISSSLAALRRSSV
jgi:F-type H+-transporting ATPase subunit b